MLAAAAPLWLALIAAPLGGCEDPVTQEQIDALGPESPDVLPGPQHRPGQPCMYCHGSAGPASRFTAAGTIYRAPSSEQRSGGVEVRLIDAAHRPHIAYTNCAGNFFVMPQEYEPVMPLWVSVYEPRQMLLSDMESAMNRDGNCGACHQAQKSPTSAGRVFLSDDPAVTGSVSDSACGGGQP